MSLDGKIHIVYDIDDVLNNLNDYVFNRLGISDRPRQFNIMLCDQYTAEQKEKILESYGNPEVFENVAWVPGAYNIFDIERTGKALVSINSSNFNTEVMEVKRKRLHEIPNINWDRVNLHIGKGYNKEAIDTADIVVEDCITNTIKYRKDTIKLLINKSHNQAETYGIDEKVEGIIRVNSLIEANEYIQRYVETH